MMTSDDLKERIEAIETGYEFMLAYAAQGRQTDKGAAAGRNVREYLDKMVAALDGLSAVIDARASGLDPEPAEEGRGVLRGRRRRRAASRSRPFGSCSRARTSARSSSTT